MIKNFWFRFVLTLLLVLAMMTVIFIMSDQDAENSSESSGMIVDFVIRIIFKDFDKMEVEKQLEIRDILSAIIRKAAHFSEFFLLELFAFLHITVLKEKIKITRPLLLSFIFSALYAVSDEVHQLFISGRACDLKDVLIDCAGAAFFVVIVLLIRFIKEEKKKSLR